MKTTLLFLISFFAYQTLFGQTGAGISVQGIARDSEKAALVDQVLKFTFDIQDSEDGYSYYKEDVDIKTDPYGVFSHIIGTSSSKSGVFNEIPFNQAHMKLVISANGTVISDAPFQYAPYAMSAFSAANGVPTGAIMPFVGEADDIPKGWVLCDGRDLNSIDGSGALIELVGNYAPDLQGMFLRGTGTSPVNGQDGPDLGDTQNDAFKTHDIDAEAATDPGHKHRLTINVLSTPGENYVIRSNTISGKLEEDHWTSNDGAHSHEITGKSEGGGAETRPVNYGVNYIIKL